MPQWAAAREFEWYTLYMYEFVSSGNFELTLLTSKHWQYMSNMTRSNLYSDPASLR